MASTDLEGTASTGTGPGVHPGSHPDTTHPGAHGAYLLLRTVFVVAPVLFGLDKFAGVLTDWEHYLAPWINDLVPGSAHDAMLLVGVVEVAAGVLVALAPRLG